MDTLFEKGKASLRVNTRTSAHTADLSILVLILSDKALDIQGLHKDIKKVSITIRMGF